MTLQGIVNLIQNAPLVHEHTEKHRYYDNQNNRTAATREKSSCPCFAVAVRFAGGKQQAHISGWTSLCIVDIDDVPADRLSEVMAAVRTSPYTLLSYTTISGKGIRILFKTDGLTADNTKQNLKHYRQAFDQGNRYYAELTGYECDLKCKNATRLSGLSHDPDVYFNPKATPFHLEPLTPRPTPAQNAAGKRKLKKALAGAARTLQNEGIAYEPHHRNEYIMRTDEHNTLPLPETNYVKERYADVTEIESFLGSQATFRQNVITGQCEVAFGNDSGNTDATPAPTATNGYVPLTDRDVNTLWSRMNKEFKPVRLNDIYNVQHSEYVPSFNPFREYLYRLKPWDGVTDYIGALADTVHVKGDQKRFKEYFRKWFVNILPTLLEEHAVNHEILVLIGPQGSYKTTWFSRLLPPELQCYFYTKMNSGTVTKDDLFTLTEFALICLEEIDEMRPAELS